VVLFAFPGSRNLFAQTGDHTLYGDLIVDESKATGLTPLNFDVILYSETKILVTRQWSLSFQQPANGSLRTGY
jgi:hypothetical protein